MKSNAELGKEDATSAGRPMIVSIVSVVTFLVGSVGLLLGVIAGVGALLLRVNLSGFHVLVIMFWFVLGPCLILAGYNLWKRRKWAAQLATATLLLDLASGIVSVDILAVVIDTTFLVLMGFAWKHLQ